MGASAWTRKGEKEAVVVLANLRLMLAMATVTMKITTAVANMMVVTAVPEAWKARWSKLITAKTALALTRNKRRSAMASVVPKHMWVTETVMTTTTTAVAITTAAIAVLRAKNQFQRNTVRFASASTRNKCLDNPFVLISLRFMDRRPWYLQYTLV